MSWISLDCIEDALDSNIEGSFLERAGLFAFGAVILPFEAVDKAAKALGAGPRDDSGDVSSWGDSYP